MSDPATKIDVDPFQCAPVEETLDPFSRLIKQSVAANASPALGAAATARFHGFGLDERPLLTDLPDLPGEMVVAQSVVPLCRQQIGSRVVVLFEQGDVRRPIVMGVLQASAATAAVPHAGLVDVKADGERWMISAEREIVLRCGDASITLTRAGKVIIKGKYIISRSSGYNRIKGAAVDIN